MRCSISQVARATTAAPLYVSSIQLGEGIKAVELLGPGITNPSVEGYRSVKEASGSDPALIISIGSGIGSGESHLTIRSSIRYVPSFPISFTRAEHTHSEMESI